ncbi:MAG: thioredoxin [Reichenbachiella sp.]|uniref:thioredoxin n=1 Tax=Reichenbachiella sp. TaxID=2184521 RepID=UPI0032679BFF
MDNINHLIKQSESPVLVDFYTNWCQPCHHMTPVIDEIAHEMAGKIEVLKVDVDRNMTLATEYKVRSIPTFILFYKGAILWQQSGIIARHVMEAEIRKSLIPQS